MNKLDFGITCDGNYEANDTGGIPFILYVKKNPDSDWEPLKWQDVHKLENWNYNYKFGFLKVHTYNPEFATAKVWPNGWETVWMAARSGDKEQDESETPVK